MRDKYDEWLDLFQIKPGAVVSLVGGGGKTSLMFALAHAAAARHSVITTTTTKIKMPSPKESPETWVHASEAALEARWLARRAHVRQATLAGGWLKDENKLIGLRAEFIDRLAQAGRADIIMVEADGAKGRSLKAPNETEPVIPAATTQLIAVIGADALGQPFGEATVFRSVRARRLVGAPPGNLITPEWAAALVTHPDGICKGAPSHARMVFSINKVESPAAEHQARRLADEIHRRRPRPDILIVAGSLHQTVWRVLS